MEVPRGGQPDRTPDAVWGQNSGEIRGEVPMLVLAQNADEASKLRAPVQNRVLVRQNEVLRQQVQGQKLGRVLGRRDLQKQMSLRQQKRAQQQQ